MTWGKALGITALLVIIVGGFWSGISNTMRIEAEAASTGLQSPTLYDAETTAVAAGTVQSLEGKKIPLKSYRGKWLLLNIWATWCGPCRMEMPDLNAIWKKEHPAGLEMLGITDEDPETVSEFLKSAPPDAAIHYPVALDKDSLFKMSLHVDSIPRTLLVNPDGKVVYDKMGATTEIVFRQALKAAGFPLQ